MQYQIICRYADLPSDVVIVMDMSEDDFLNKVGQIKSHDLRNRLIKSIDVPQYT